MHNYLNLLQHILKNGTKRMDRTGTGTLSVFGHQMRFNLEEGFPLVTTKRIHLKSVVHELLWFLSGDTNIRYLNEHGVSIWDEWADEHGELGPIYGKQWRSWESPDGSTIDQISNVIKSISTNPDSRRHIVNAWNVADVEKIKVSPPPCHVMFQFYVANGKLSCMLTQRSADVFLGVPFNIASYSLLTHMVANQCGLSVGEFIWSGGDCHIYSNHIEQVNTQLSREPLPLPTLKIKRKPENIFEYQFDDFDFVNYQYHEKITAPIAV